MSHLQLVAARGLPSSAPHRYRGFGLRMAANVPVPGLAADDGSAEPDVCIALASRGTWWREHAREPGRVWRIHPEADEAGRPLVQVRRSRLGDRFHLRFADGTEFALDAGARRIWGSWPPHLSGADAATYLVGPVLGFARRLRGGLALHASAASIGGAAVLFIGSSGAGKSTLAAALAERGHPILCDDAATMTLEAGRVLVHPGCPQVRLWPDAVQALYGAADRLPLLTPNWSKRYLDLTAISGGFCAQAMPLAAAYLLEPRTQDAGAPRISALSPRDALRLLLAHSYAGFLQDASMRAREFRALAEIAGTLTLKRLRPPAQVERIGLLCDRIVEDATAQKPR